jgi:HEAT repeat protein
MAVGAALGKIGDPAVKPLIATLRDESHEGQEIAAVRALGGIGDERAADQFFASQLVQEVAARALGEIGDPRAVEPLIATLKNGNSEAAKALGKIGDPRAVEPLIATLKGKNSLTFLAAFDALENLGPSAVEALIAALKEEEHEAFARLLKAITGQDFGIDSNRWEKWWKKHH